MIVDVTKARARALAPQGDGDGLSFSPIPSWGYATTRSSRTPEIALSGNASFSRG